MADACHNRLLQVNALFDPQCNVVSFAEGIKGPTGDALYLCVHKYNVQCEMYDMCKLHITYNMMYNMMYMTYNTMCYV
jgi:hypothetical protein